MSMFRITPLLRENQIAATCLAWYAWKEPSTPTVVGEMHFDSMGIFATKTICGIHRSLNYYNFETYEDLDEWDKGQGFVLTSYLGGKTALWQTLDNIHVRGEQAELPYSKQVDIDTSMWDGSSRLRGNEKKVGMWWTSDGHMPLLVYMGKTPLRKNTSITRREERAILRGYGPGSENRRRVTEQHAQKRAQSATHGHGAGRGHGHGRGRGDGQQGGSSSSTVWRYGSYA